MSDLGRLLPPGFAQSYWNAFGEVPPADFLEAYELLCDALYYGARVAVEPGEERKKGKRYSTGLWFGEPTLLGFKGATDNRLAAIRAALRRWTAEKAREAAGGSGPRADRGGDRAAAGGVRDRDPASRDQEA